MEEIGKLIQEARLKKGAAFEDIYNAIKIQEKYLKAIENGDISVFSVEMYYKAFMKSYAEFLGLNAEELAQKYESGKRSASAEPGEQSAQAADTANAYSDEKNFFIREKFSKIGGAPNANRNIFIGAALLAVILIISVIVIIMQIHPKAPLDESDGNEGAAIESYSSETALPQGSQSQGQSAPLLQGQSPVSATAGSLVQGQQQAAAPAQKPTVVPPKQEPPKPAVPQTPAPAAPAITAQPQIQETMGGGSQILTITTLDDVWVRIESDGEMLFEGIIPKNTQRTWRANDRFRLRTGYARALKVTHNGQEIDASKGAKDDVNTILLTR